MDDQVLDESVQSALSLVVPPAFRNPMVTPGVSMAARLVLGEWLWCHPATTYKMSWLNHSWAENNQKPLSCYRNKTYPKLVVVI